MAAAPRLSRRPIIIALREKGVTIRKTIGMIIGAYCILESLPLLHADRDFDPMERHLGLSVWRG